MLHRLGVYDLMARPSDTAKIHPSWLNLQNDIRLPPWLLELDDLASCEAEAQMKNGSGSIIVGWLCPEAALPVPPVTDVELSTCIQPSPPRRVREVASVALCRVLDPTLLAQAAHLSLPLLSHPDGNARHLKASQIYKQDSSHIGRSSLPEGALAVKLAWGRRGA